MKKKVKIENLNHIQINQKLFQIKKDKKKIPTIDFTLRLDAYHANDK